MSCLTLLPFRPLLGAAAVPLPQPRRTADTRLGEFFLALIPGQLYYSLALLYPLASALAGLGAVYAPALALWLAALPPVRALGPLSPLLAHIATTQPGATLLSVLVSLLTAYLAFIVMPLGDFLLGRDLRNPSEVCNRTIGQAGTVWQAMAGVVGQAMAGTAWLALRPDYCTCPRCRCCSEYSRPCACIACQAVQSLGKAKFNPTDRLFTQTEADGLQDEVVADAQDALYRAVLFTYVPMHIAVLAGMCHLLATTAVHPLAFLGATLSAGVSGGILFTTAHELLHGGRWDPGDAFSSVDCNSSWC
jgi:hypothetical protein